MKTSEMYYDLFSHLSNEHDLTLLDSQLEEIIRIVDEMKEKKII